MEPSFITPKTRSPVPSMTFSPPTPAAPVLLSQPAQPPMLGTNAQGQKPQPKSSQPTFLGGMLTANPANTGQKTLLGQ